MYNKKWKAKKYRSVWKCMLIQNTGSHSASFYVQLNYIKSRVKYIPSVFFSQSSFHSYYLSLSALLCERNQKLLFYQNVDESGGSGYGSFKINRFRCRGEKVAVEWA